MFFQLVNSECTQLSFEQLAWTCRKLVASVGANSAAATGIDRSPMSCKKNSVALAGAVGAYNSRNAMKSSLEETLIEVWRQVLVENAAVVQLGANRYPVKRTSKRGLRQVEFTYDGNELRGLEQNPETKSRWAQLARSGKKVMQFLGEGHYVANVVDGEVTIYGS